MTSSGVEVTWQDPSESIDLEQFDKVLIGVSSPLALGSNRVYGSYAMIQRLWGDPRLRLFIDAPDPNNITRGLASVNRKPSSLTKDFFSYRKDFKRMEDPTFRYRVLAACEALRNQEWPEVIAPALPWMTRAQLEGELPDGAMYRSVPVNLDQIILDRYRDEETLDRARESRWMVERGTNRKWVKSLALSQPVLSMRSDYRQSLNPYYVDRLGTARGLLHSPVRKGLCWWSPKVAMALSQNTPVFTSWREAGGFLGEPWNVLPGTFEYLTQDSQLEIGQKQYDTYAEAISNGDQTKASLFKTLDMEMTVND